MTEIELFSVREHPELADDMIAFFQRHWATKESMKVYENCIRSCLETDSPLPQWYVLMLNGKIVAGAGLITNDFISRMDLWPWLAALYVEEECRGCGKCVQRCGQGALCQDPETKRAVIDNNKCVLCGYCAKICPECALKII